MRVVVDGFALHGTSVSIVTEHLLDAWAQTFPDDELHLVMGPDAVVPTPAAVTRHVHPVGRRRTLGRLWRQNVTLPRLCRRLDADVLLAAVPSTTITPLPCPRVLIHHDLQHELRPQNFSRALRLIRTTAYSISFRQADAVSCISARTRDDLLRSRPFLVRRDVRVVRHGTDHVEWMRGARDPGDYAIAFGQYANKNVELLLRGWQQLARTGDAMPLHVVGLSAQAREAVGSRARELGIDGYVVALPWLRREEYDGEFANAALVMFLSDYEGFGLPVVEAMRVGIPVVVTPEPAVLEASAGFATVTTGWDPDDVADGVRRALRLDATDLRAAREHALTLTWQRSVEQLRDLVADTVRRAGRAQ